MRTVFILGAGASHPYGLPLGYTLVSDIVQVLNSSRSNFKNWGFTDTQIQRFHDAIKFAKPKAIDDLLVQRKEFLEIGKLAIAHTLTQYEKEENLFRRDNSEDWYGYFVDHLRTSKGPPPNERYAFITFNYDRSLEYFLAKSTINFYGKDDSAKVAAFLSIPILHIHGHFGVLPEYDGTAPYAPTNDHSQIRQVSAGLRLTDDEIDPKTLAEAQILIQKAAKIRFLGFGYHEANLRKFEFDRNAERCNDIKGTTLGISGAEIAIIKRKHPKFTYMDREERTILRFFRDKYALEP